MDDEREEASLTLTQLRARIDALDDQLVALLNERARIVVEVGAEKRGSGSPVYAPDREAHVLRRVVAGNRGPLSDRALEAMYRELMSGSFALERPLRIGYLGPAGSFSHAAAVAHFGSSVTFENLHEIAGVFTEVVRGHVDYGLVPIENSLGGGIVDTLDAFRDYPEGVGVGAEVRIAVRHHLLSNCQPSAVRRIFSKPEVFAQCRRWVRSQYPSAELVPAPSSAAAARDAADVHVRDPGLGVAAIGSALAGELYGLRVLFESIEDKPDNVTRFYVISREQPGPTGRDRTAIMFRTDDRPGALISVLRAFADAGINMTHIDKRPSGGKNWSYTFFVDVEGHKDDSRVADALTAARDRCQELRVLGSYPEAQRVL